MSLSLAINPNFFSNEISDLISEPLCKGRVPRDQKYWPPSAGAHPWRKYHSLQHLCVGLGSVSSTPRSPNGEVTSGSDATPLGSLSSATGTFIPTGTDVSETFSSSLLCRCPKIHGELSCYVFGNEGLKLHDYCSRYCSCEGWSSSDPGDSDHPDTEEWSSAFLGTSLGNEADQKRRKVKDEDTCSSQSCFGFGGCLRVRKKRGCENAVCRVQQVGKDGLFGLGRCVGGILAGTASSGLLGGRSDERGGIARQGEEILACACNSTYVSSACCSAHEDGLVWEDWTARLGEVTQADD